LVEVFQMRVLLRQLGPAQALGVAVVGAFQALGIEQQGKALVEA